MKKYIIIFILSFLFGVGFNKFMIDSDITSAKENARSVNVSLKLIETSQTQYFNKNGFYANNFSSLNIDQNKLYGYYDFILCDDYFIRRKTEHGKPYGLPKNFRRCHKDQKGYYVYAIGDRYNDGIYNIFILSNEIGILYILDDSKYGLSRVN